MYWDESNRLRVVVQQESMQHYLYDASGERVLKAGTDVQQVFQNGTLLDNSIIFNNYTIYPSAFLVVDPNGIYSKHYYAGSQRIVSRLANGRFRKVIEEAPEPKAPNYKTQQQAQLNDLQGYVTKAGKGKVQFAKFKTATLEDIEKAQEESDKGPITASPILAPSTDTPRPRPSEPIYYYHPDHLGTSTFLTDANGNAYQFFLNLPFGETMAEQLPSSYYNSPYKFNGKELDEETGLYYYGARYYDARSSIWLSVDPLTEQGPEYSPYCYTFNNPINLTDPDVRWPFPTGPIINPIYTVKFVKFIKSASNRIAQQAKSAWNSATNYVKSVERNMHGIDFYSGSGENGTDDYQGKRHGPNVDSKMDADAIYDVASFASGGESGNTFKKGSNTIEKVKVAAEMVDKVKEGLETGGKIGEWINEHRNQDDTSKSDTVFSVTRKIDKNNYNQDFVSGSKKADSIMKKHPKAVKKIEKIY